MADSPRNILGIDFGSSRIGLALASLDTKIAQPLATIEANDGVIEKLRHVATANDVSHIVVGLPRNLDGDDTAQTAEARKFASHLKTSIKVPVTLQDEALTSETALERLKARHTGTIKKELIDQEAAAIILQDYLDSL